MDGQAVPEAKETHGTQVRGSLLAHGTGNTRRTERHMNEEGWHRELLFLLGVILKQNHALLKIKEAALEYCEHQTCVDDVIKALEEWKELTNENQGI